ncbi:hypothetical protein, partial [Mycobacterium sp.]|uniref:hypothetical protein n=1 Tax=Mycobacterium sp. TaxID=1785 RepID=UPI002B6064C1
MTSQDDAIEAFIFGGAAAPALKFPTPGTTHKGTISGAPRLAQQKDFQTKQLLTWSDGSPRMQLVIPLQVDQRDGPADDGKRTLYIKGQQLTQALRDALDNARVRGVEPGGCLVVAYVGDDNSGGAVS